MSLIGNIREYTPKVARFLGSVAAGNDPVRRPLRISVSIAVLIVAVIIAAVSANGSLLAIGLNTSADVGLSDSVNLNANPSTILEGGSLTLQAKISHSFPNAEIKVTITVTGPSGSGIAGFEMITITTNPAGNGITNLAYPFTAPFVGTASTSASGTYDVTATFILVYPIATASTTFAVR